MIGGRISYIAIEIRLSRLSLLEMRKGNQQKACPTGDVDATVHQRAGMQQEFALLQLDDLASFGNTRTTALVGMALG